MNTIFTARAALVVAALVALRSAPAAAIQPLGEFMVAARTHNHDNREAALIVRQREHQVDQAKWDMTPTVAATAGYTRNQYQVQVTLPGSDPSDPSNPINPINPITRTITPFNQLDAQVTLTQPIVDVAIFRNIEVSRSALAASAARVGATRLPVEQAVAQAYYQVVAAEAFIGATLEVHQAARASLEIVEQRAAAGVASDLDRRRAQVEVERGNKAIADAEYNLAIARQRIVSLSGLEAQPGELALAVALSEEPPLASFLDGQIDLVASVRSSAADAKNADIQVRAATALLYPTLSASASERFTNATGFLGKYAIASASLNLAWRFDLAIIPQLRAARTQSALAQVRVDRSRQQARDAVHNAWHQVKAALAKARSARVERDTSRAAFKQSRQRYEAGTGIFLEVTQAERDAFSAQISLIQANADLAYARIALRLAAGRDLKEAEVLLRDTGEPTELEPPLATPTPPTPGEEAAPGQPVNESPKPLELAR